MEKKRGGNRTGGWRILEILFNARTGNDLSRFERSGLIKGGEREGVSSLFFYFWNLGLQRSVAGGKCADAETFLKKRQA